MKIHYIKYLLVFLSRSQRDMAAGNGTEGRRNFTCISFLSNGNAVALYAELLWTAPTTNSIGRINSDCNCSCTWNTNPKTQPTNLFDSTTLHNDNIIRQLKILGTSAIKCAKTHCRDLELRRSSWKLCHCLTNCKISQSIRETAFRSRWLNNQGNNYTLRSYLRYTHILVYWAYII